jgi:spore coat polysaccharide biosynthesis protein SpsF
MLGLVVARLRRADRLDHVVVATSAGAIDDELANWGAKADVDVVRGPEDDVLARFALAAAATAADVVVRVTADCPLIDPGIIDTAVDDLVRTGADYVLVGNDTGLPLGVNAEVVRRAALDRAATDAVEPFEREHVTPHLRAHPDRFALRALDPPDALRRPGYRLCVDEPADLDMVRALVDALGSDPVEVGIAEVIELLDARPDLVSTNAAVSQRAARESNPSGRG